MIKELPSYEEAEKILLGFEEAEDWDSYEAWLNDFADRAWKAYHAYISLSEEQKVLVTNYDHLMETAALWSTLTLSGTLLGKKLIFNYAVTSDITNMALLECKNDTMESVGNGDTTPSGKTYKTNSEVITNSELITAADGAESLDIIIYAEPGMAIGFEAGTVWPTDTSRVLSTEDEIWFWTWADSVNYAILKSEEVSLGKNVTFPITAVSGSTELTVNVTICAVGRSEPVLLKDSIPSDYSIKTIPVTLYDYDGVAFNEYYNQNSENYIAFSGYSQGISSTTVATNRGWTQSGTQANGGGSAALMGIVEKDLVNGLPVMSQGQQVDLFSTNEIPGKTVYPNVGFQFIYNENSGYYTYNSALNHAQYNEENNTIELYAQSLAMADTPNGATHGNAGFYPFEDINDTFTNTGYERMDTETWKEKLEENAFELIPAQYSTDIVNTSSVDPASTANMHYGLYVSNAFYLPKNKQINGEDMIYEFTGDDDLWVFIDDRLVLDIGGGHTYVSGSFNITNGEVWIEKYAQLSADDGGYYEVSSQGTDLNYTDEFLVNLEDEQMHTIQIFYLERHSGVSNCRIKFNLPLLPENSLTVSKELLNSDDSGIQNYLKDSIEYQFKVLKADENGNPTEESFMPAKTEYSILENGVDSGRNGYVDENGYFYLKAEQSAQFENIMAMFDGAETANYIVQEVLLTEFMGQYGDVEYEISGDINLAINSGLAPEYFTSYLTESISTKETQMIIYRNRINTAELGRLSVSKTAAKSSAFKEDDTFQIRVLFSGDPLTEATVYLVGEEERESLENGIIE
ncbi:MAG: fibro-slime domain-containing protein, partial [Lachnospiraceae bacterium]|nr:fibro-slime domain-containing protein [Lachnospiraceae bacterium]